MGSLAAAFTASTLWRGAASPALLVSSEQSATIKSSWSGGLQGNQRGGFQKSAELEVAPSQNLDRNPGLKGPTCPNQDVSGRAGGDVALLSLEADVGGL